MGLIKAPGRIFDRATQSFLGSPTSALQLCLLRILIPMWCLFAGVGSQVASTNDLTSYLFTGFQVALVLLMLGIGSRLSAGYCLLAGGYLLNLSYHLGHATPANGLLPFLFLIFTLSPSSDYLSVSRLVMGRKIHSLLAYSLPAHFIRLLLVLIYFSSAISELRTNGLGSFLGGQQEAQLSLQLLSGVGLFVQLLAPLALLWRTRYFILVLFLFELGNSFSTGHFSLSILTLVLWFPFRRVMRFTPIFNETTPKPLLLMKSFYLYALIILIFIFTLLTQKSFWPFSF